MKEKQKCPQIANLIVSFVAVAGMFVLYRLFTDFIYLTNDDMYLQSIVSGEISGKPDAHMIYSNYILGMVLSFLYSCTTQVPWYGIYLLGVCFLCAWIVLYRCVSKCENRINRIAVIILFLVISFCAVFRHIAMMQYTVVAAFAGGTAVFYAMTMDMKVEKKHLMREYAIVLLLAFLSLIIREKVFLMMVPFAAFGWLGKWIAEQDKSKTNNIKYISLLVSIVCLMLVVGGIDRLAYRIGSEGEAWQEYKRYNKAREQIMDYNSYPDYDSNQEFYEELGISKASYEGVSKYYLLLPQKDYNGETMPIIAKKAIDLGEESHTLSERLLSVVKNFIQCNLNYSDRPMNIVVYATWLCMVVLLVFSKSKNMLWQLALLLVARMGMWLYIIYQGRYPDRITQGLYFVELLMLVAIFILNMDALNGKNLIKRCFLIGATVVICVPSLYIGISKAMAVKGENAGKLYFGTSYQQVKDYCADNKDNIYLIDMNSASFFSSSIFRGVEGENGICDNLIPLGSWPVKSPLVADNLKRYGVKDITENLVNNEHVYFVFKDSEATPSQYLVDFYNGELEEVNVELNQADVLKTDAGIDYIFYRLESIQ